MSAAIWMTLAALLVLAATLCGSVAFILASEGRARSGLFTIACFGGLCGVAAVVLLTMGPS